MAQAHLGAVFNKDSFDLINNYTYGMRLPIFGSRQYSILVQSSLEMVVSWKELRARLLVWLVIFNSEI